MNNIPENKTWTFTLKLEVTYHRAIVTLLRYTPNTNQYQREFIYWTLNWRKFVQVQLFRTLKLQAAYVALSFIHIISDHSDSSNRIKLENNADTITASYRLRALETSLYDQNSPALCRVSRWRQQMLKCCLNKDWNRRSHHHATIRTNRSVWKKLREIESSEGNQNQQSQVILINCIQFEISSGKERRIRCRVDRPIQ